MLLPSTGIGFSGSSSPWTSASVSAPIAIASPIFGAIADRRGARKPWLAGFSLLCMLCSAMLWFTQPSVDWVVWDLFFFALGNFAFEVSTVFYNAMLPSLVPATTILPSF